MPLVEQSIHQRCVHPGPLVLGINLLKFPCVHSGYKPNCLTRVALKDNLRFSFNTAFGMNPNFAIANRGYYLSLLEKVMALSSITTGTDYIFILLCCIRVRRRRIIGRWLRVLS